MNRFITLFCLLTGAIFAQYNNQTVAEKDYEHSDLFFQSSFMNPFGIAKFKDVAPGMINDPFLNLHINPAMLPDLDTANFLLYLDFRGDQTEPRVVQSFVYPMMTAKCAFVPYPSYDPRLLSTARTEPEPVVSFGILGNPLKNFLPGFNAGLTYQMIHKETKYYTMPFSIYNPNIYYDAFGKTVALDSNIPVIDRQSGKDEMTNDAHQITLFAGSEITDRLAIGLSFSCVFQNRDGGYINDNNNNNYSGYNSGGSSSGDENARNQKYHHTDISLGLQYRTCPQFIVGAVAGILQGKSEQSHTKYDYYNYNYNHPNVDPTWSLNDSKNSTAQNWVHDGTTSYLGFNFSNRQNDDREITGYYRFQSGEEDISNNTTIFDTSYYTYKYNTSYNNGWYHYNGASLTSDKRNENGDKKVIDHKFLINVRLKITPLTHVAIGFSYDYTKTTIESQGPVNSLLVSTSQYLSDNTSNNYSYFYSQTENKTMLWNYSSSIWSFQIPVILTHKFNDHFGCIIGLNRIITSTKINEQTLAIYSLRKTINGSNINQETNFAERYTEPDQKFSENTTDMIVGFTLDITSQFGAKLLINPESEPNLRVAQWWLGFTVKI